MCTRNNISLRPAASSFSPEALWNLSEGVWPALGRIETHDACQRNNRGSNPYPRVTVTICVLSMVIGPQEKQPVLRATLGGHGISWEELCGCNTDRTNRCCHIWGLISRIDCDCTVDARPQISQPNQPVGITALSGNSMPAHFWILFLGYNTSVCHEYGPLSSIRYPASLYFVRHYYELLTEPLWYEPEL